MKNTSGWLRIAAIIASSTISLTLILAGVDTSVYTNSSSAARKRVHRVYLAFWTPPDRALVVCEWEEAVPCALEQFLLKHARRPAVPSDEHWNLDQVSRGSLWGVGIAITPASPGLYLPFGSSGNEASESSLSVFLESYQESRPSFADEVARFLDEPRADWTFAWRQKVQREYKRFSSKDEIE